MYKNQFHKIAYQKLSYSTVPSLWQKGTDIQMKLTSEFMESGQRLQFNA